MNEPQNPSRVSKCPVEQEKPRLEKVKKNVVITIRLVPKVKES